MFVAVALTSPLLATAKSHKVHAEAKTSAADTGVTKFNVKGADGSVKNYQIEVPANLPPGGTGGKISQQEAVLAALGWAPGFYGSTGTAAISAEYKTTPTTYIWSMWPEKSGIQLKRFMRRFWKMGASSVLP